MERVVFVALLTVSATVLASPFQENRPSGAVELRAMHDFACMCPTCNRLPLDECGCDFAATMRGEVKAQLRGADLSTAEKRDAAYDAVRAAFVAKYGKEVLTTRPEVKTSAGMSWLPLLILAAGLFGFVLVTRRSLKRRRAGDPAR